MIYKVSHRTVLRYATPAGPARYTLRLRPTAWHGQRVLDWKLALSPEPVRLSPRSGPWPVESLRVELAGGFRELAITSSFTVAVEPPALPSADLPLGTVRRLALDARALDGWAPASYLFPSPLVPLSTEITAWAGRFLLEPRGVLSGARALASAIHSEFAYQPGTTGAATSPLAAFSARRGVCQDFAQIMIAALRGHGVPAAYVSGYLATQPPPGQPRLTGADAMHAWVNVWCGEDAGWVAIDPTNDCLAGETHVAIAMGRDYGDVSPVDGVFLGQSRQDMLLAVDVIPIGAE